MLVQLFRTSKGFGFDLSDPMMSRRPGPSDYNALNDPYLKGFMDNAAMQRRLHEHGLLSSSGRVQCSLRELNQFRNYLHSHSLKKINVKQVTDHNDSFNYNGVTLRILHTEQWSLIYW